MSYQVLARKWRPNSFESLAGQSHIVRALTNALDQQRLHHAYLFTGTRGVGKTTLGRILAKCLNCEAGISSTPCNHCRSCQEIDNGRFIDLIEVDAASRTKVEDTRELLENVPYAPTNGRFKVYLIDEVHMLSSHSFNALLKTLEEPPLHVKFLLATTDPQKLPITVLSRCLQFHLKCLSPEQIVARLAFILEQETFSYEPEALQRLAHAAEGSMRDALSLLDQAIAFSNGNVTAAAIKIMLSTIETTYLYEILEALAAKHASQLIDITRELADQAADFANVLEELLSLLHQIALAQYIPDRDLQGWDSQKISHFSKQFIPEDIQLYYQIGLIGRKDLSYAPTPRSGFEMILLRMLAFTPDHLSLNHPASSPVPTQIKAKPNTASGTMQWSDILPHLNLTGMSSIVANHCILEKLGDSEIILLLDPKQSVLLTKKNEDRIKDALQSYFQRPLKLTLTIGKPDMETPAVLNTQAQIKQLMSAEESIQQDSNVQKIITTFDAKVLPDSIGTNENK